MALCMLLMDAHLHFSPSQITTHIIARQAYTHAVCVYIFGYKIFAFVNNDVVFWYIELYSIIGYRKRK